MMHKMWPNRTWESPGQIDSDIAVVQQIWYSGKEPTFVTPVTSLTSMVHVTSMTHMMHMTIAY